MVKLTPPFTLGQNTTLLTVDSATVCIAHTKNETKGAAMHHKEFGRPICPVAALA
jgi:hypothetical protein